MAYKDWEQKSKNFEVADLREMKGNFFPWLKKKAENTPVEEGFGIIQSFEPFPLYQTMESLGYEYHTETPSKNEYHVSFYRVKNIELEGDSPFKPIALLNFPIIDEDLGNLAMDFWKLTWDSDNRALPYETRLLLSLSNAVGAGRMRQASRELIKAYSVGVKSEVFDDLFELFAWNQGIGHFASEIGQSALFKAYKLIKENEKKNKSRDEIMNILITEFSEKNPETGVK